MSCPWQNNRITVRRFPALALIALVALAAGCSGQQQAAPPPPAAPAAAPAQKQPIASAPTATVASIEPKKADEYIYRAAGRRDPFAPIVSRQEKKSAVGPPLERHNVTEFKLSGIVWGGFGYNAMLEGPDGKGYFVRVGTIIGPNHGVIKKITQNAIIVEEKFKNVMGETERKEIVVELRKKQEGTP